MSLKLLGKISFMVFLCILFSSNLFANFSHKIVNEKDLPQIYKTPEDVKGILQTLDEYGVVVIKGIYSKDSLRLMESQWDVFMEKFYAYLDSPEAKTTITEYGTSFFEGLKVNRYLTHVNEDFISYQLGPGRYEIRLNNPQKSFVSEEVLTPKPLQDLLKNHFYLSDLYFASYSYNSFYGLLPSAPGNKDGNLHRDTTVLEVTDIDGSITIQFTKAFYITSIIALGFDAGSTEFYLGSHKMTGGEVENRLKAGQIKVIRPIVNEGDVKLFDGRIGHRGVATPAGNPERKAIYGVHHASWYIE